MPNLLEYGMGGDPRTYESTLAPKQEVVGNNLVFTYQVDTGASGYGITPQVSSQLAPLASWTAVPSTVVSTEGTIETRTVTLPIVPGTRQYIRLRIASGPPVP